LMSSRWIICIMLLSASSTLNDRVLATWSPASASVGIMTIMNIPRKG
jgi:hypothetical protein